MGKEDSRLLPPKKISAVDYTVNNSNPIIGETRHKVVAIKPAENVKYAVEGRSEKPVEIKERIYVLRFDRDLDYVQRIFNFISPKSEYLSTQYFRTGVDQESESNNYRKFNGVNLNVQKALNAAKVKAEIENYKLAPYEFEEQDAKLFHPMALTGSYGDASIYFKRKSNMQMQTTNKEIITMWWDNLQKAVLAYYMMKYPDTEDIKKRYSEGFKTKNEEYCEALTRSGRYMWGEWEPTQGFHRGIDYVLTDANDDVLKTDKTGYAPIYAMSDCLFINTRKNKNEPNVIYNLRVQDINTGVIINYTHLNYTLDTSKLKRNANEYLIIPAGTKIGTEYFNSNEKSTIYPHVHLEMFGANSKVNYMDIFWRCQTWNDVQNRNDITRDGNKIFPSLNAFNAYYLAQFPYNFIVNIWKNRMGKDSPPLYYSLNQK